MGDTAVNSAVETELQFEKKKNLDITEGDSASAPAPAPAVGSSPITTWERFLPKMVRVMLVEADDSTRQIIAALLRKCSYRVTAVSDGLKAWELLKGKPCGIDLILTEVELPSISGYALLTLIMEHDACKNIPVIMMSSHDSMSTVYKCMLRGAADFLVKPVRKNELRNLWQHVWRKQTSSTSAGLGPPDMSVAEEKDEATDENNAVSNHSSGYKSSGQRTKQCIEKGSDAQSSCTNPEMETEAEVEPDHCISLLKTAKCPADGNDISTCEEHHQESRKRQACGGENGESQITATIGAEHNTKRAVKNPDDTITKNSCALENSSKEAIDLIGTFDNHWNSSFPTSAPNGIINQFNALPLLDLSLRRSYPDGSSNQANVERPQLNHSDASPFSKYVNKGLQLCNSMLPCTLNDYKDHETNSVERSSRHILEFHSGTSIQAGSPKQIPVATVQTQQREITFSNTQDREISHPIPVRGVRFDFGTCNSVMPSLYSAKSGSPGLPSPGTTQHSESFSKLNAFYPSEHQPSPDQQFHSPVDQRISKSIDETDNKHGDKLDDQKHVSPGKGQSNNSSYCNGNMGHNQSPGSGSNGTISTTATTSECGNEERLPIHEGSSHRSLQREAALTKFRLKRKDRCFEKKVRYESRKKLAEQRPRVKGQFVRQVPNDPQPRNSSETIRI